MSPNALVNVMTAAVVISAIALVAVAVMVFGMFRAITALKEQVSTFLPRAESFLSASEKAVAESRQHIQDVTTKANLILDTTQKQLVRVDEVMGEVTARAKVQMDRVEMVLDDTISRVHETAVQLNSGILKPLRELNGMAAGLRAAFQALLRGGRPNVSQATADEEMFI
jgi:ABC-type transporter Mla subunit MlaD